MGYRVVALSSSSSKQALARELGAHEYIDGSKEDQAAALQALGGAKVIMCTAPNADAIQNLISGMAIGGTMLLVALEENPITFSPSASLFPTLPSRYQTKSLIDIRMSSPPHRVASVDQRLAIGRRHR